MLVPATDVTRHTGLPQPTLRRWLAEGRLCKYGTRHRRLYDLVEVHQMMTLMGRAYRPWRVGLDGHPE